MLRQNGVDDLIKRLEKDGKHRVLRRLVVPEGRTVIPYYGGATFIGVAVDVETTGLDPATDVIIEIALRRFRYDAHGQILKVDRPWAWREDPGRALDPAISRLTGITDQDLSGHVIDENAAVRMLCSADLIIAHNAAFDRKFVEQRFPAASGRAWCCSFREVDWVAGGFDGKALGWLAAQAGWFYDAHRAQNDVDALIALLWQRMPKGHTALFELVDSARCPSVRVEATGAGFAVKDLLRKRGYRWNSEDRVWWREIQAKELPDEESWLTLHVYAPGTGSRASGPLLKELTAHERYA